MKSVTNINSLNDYRKLLDAENSLKAFHPALNNMQDLSDNVDSANPTAITRLEIYKECHRLADEIYRITGSKKLMAPILRMGDLLMLRLFGRQERQVK